MSLQWLGSVYYMHKHILLASSSDGSSTAMGLAGSTVPSVELELAKKYFHRIKHLINLDSSTTKNLNAG